MILACRQKCRRLSHDELWLFVTTTQQSEAERKDKVRGTGSIRQVEFLYLVTGEQLTVPTVDRKHQQDTNEGNLLGPYSSPAPSHHSVWKVKHGDKGKLYGAGLVAVGDRTPGEDGNNKGEKTVQANDDVPFTYHGKNSKCYEELRHSYRFKDWLDLTCNDGTLAIETLKAGGVYCGVCFTDQHKDALQAFIIEQLWIAFRTPGDPLFQPELAHICTAGGAAGSSGSAGSASGSGVPLKPKPKGKAAAGGGSTNKKPRTDTNTAGKTLSREELLEKLDQMDDDGDVEDDSES